MGKTLKSGLHGIANKMIGIVWVEGCYWETVGLINLIAEQGICIRPFSTNITPSPADVVILAWSSAPLLGWGQYLYQMERLVQHHRCTVIVLHPPGMKIVPCTPRTYLCNGKIPPDVLYDCLIHILMEGYGKNYREQMVLPVQRPMNLADLPDLSERFRHTDVLLMSGSHKHQCQDIYRERQTLTSRAGFRSTHNFRVFITGVYFPYYMERGRIWHPDIL